MEDRIMKKIKTLFLLAAASALLALVSGCIENNQPEPEQQNSGKEAKYYLSVSAVKAISTKALAVSGNDIEATWGAGETVTVHNQTKNKDLSGTLAPSSTGSATTKLVGELTGTIEKDDVLTLSFRSASYDSQEGTLAYIAANCDYATASISVSAVDGTNKVTATDADFVNQQAIVKFTLKDDMSNLISAENLTIAHGTSTITLPNIPATTYTTNGDGVVYVAIPGFASETLSLTAVAGGKTYTYEKAGVTLANDTYRRIDVYMFNELTSPLTFEAINNNTEVSFKRRGSDLNCSVEYKLNQGEWTQYSSAVTLLKSGDKIQFRGANQTYAISDQSYCYFNLSDSCYVYGNIMSLVTKVDFATDVTLEGDYTFCSLFQGFTTPNNTYVQPEIGCKIKNHEKKALALPATSLSAYCYYRMFCGCDGLYMAPELPAAQMAAYCYKEMFRATGLHEGPAFNASQLEVGCCWGMFQQCIELTSVPGNLLPATMLAPSCYRNMFNNCDALVTAPALPAEKLKENCYQSMFGNCDKFKNAPVLSSLQLADSCYCSMFFGCSAMSEAPELPAETLAKSCYMGMFEQTHLYSSPVLNAPTLVESCYKAMFASCKWLSSVTCLATDNSATDCTTNWLYNVTTDSGTRTVTTIAGTTWASNSPNGIPVNWNHNEIITTEVTTTPVFGEGWEWD